MGNVCRQLHIHVTGRRRSDEAWPQPVAALPTALALEAACMRWCSSVSSLTGLQNQEAEMQVASALYASETCEDASNIPATYLCLLLPCSVTALENRSRTARKSFSTFWKC